MADVGSLVIEIIYFALGLVTILTTIKQWKINKNKMLIAVSVYIAAVLVRSIIDIGIYTLGIDVDLIIAGYLDIGMVMGLILFTIQLNFMFLFAPVRMCIFQRMFPVFYLFQH